MSTEPETIRTYDQEIRAVLTEIQSRQEALWAIVCHGRIGITTSQMQYGLTAFVTFYMPASVGDLDVRNWWQEWESTARSCLFDSAWAALGGGFDATKVEVDWLIPVPDELADFVARSTQRPLPSRFQSTAVEFAERDGIVWLTPPEAKIYDVLKSGGWTFVPQPPFVLTEDEWSIPDFLIYWGGKANQAVLVEVDSDLFHAKPSVRERDEIKERRFESLGFGYLRYSAKDCLRDPVEVVASIKTFCEERFGPSRPVAQPRIPPSR